MNPKPFSALNHLTVPCVICDSLSPRRATPTLRGSRVFLVRRPREQRGPANVPRAAPYMALLVAHEMQIARRTMTAKNRTRRSRGDKPPHKPALRALLAAHCFASRI